MDCRTKNCAQGNTRFSFQRDIKSHVITPTFERSHFNKHLMIAHSNFRGLRCVCFDFCITVKGFVFDCKTQSWIVCAILGLAFFWGVDNFFYREHFFMPYACDIYGFRFDTLLKLFCFQQTELVLYLWFQGCCHGLEVIPNNMVFVFTRIFVPIGFFYIYTPVVVLFGWLWFVAYGNLTKQQGTTKYLCLQTPWKVIPY